MTKPYLVRVQVRADDRTYFPEIIMPDTCDYWYRLYPRLYSDRVSVAFEPLTMEQAHKLGHSNPDYPE